MSAELKVAQQRLLNAIDVLHDGQGLDALRLMDAINDLILAHLHARVEAIEGPQHHIESVP